MKGGGGGARSQLPAWRQMRQDKAARRACSRNGGGEGGGAQPVACLEAGRIEPTCFSSWCHRQGV